MCFSFVWFWFSWPPFSSAALCRTHCGSAHQTITLMWTMPAIQAFSLFRPCTLSPLCSPPSLCSSMWWWPCWWSTWTTPTRRPKRRRRWMQKLNWSWPRAPSVAWAPLVAGVGGWTKDCFLSDRFPEVRQDERREEAPEGRKKKEWGGCNMR